MNKRVFVTLIAFFLFISSIIFAADNIQEKESYLNIYYFRGTFRCANCYKIEEHTTEAMEKYFKDEINSGEFVYNVINIDKKENHHFVDDYGLFTKSVVLSKIENKKETKHKSLLELWKYIEDKEKFHECLKREIKSFLE